MRILLAAKHAPDGPRPIGGVQSWCRTIAGELRKRGHEAITWGPGQPIPVGGFDFGIISNAGDTARAFDWCRQTVNICHGIIPAEQPRIDDLTMYTSEEVRDHWCGAGPIIRQPIDTEFWSPDSWGLKVFLARFSYRSGLGFVMNLATDLNLAYTHIRNEGQEEVRRILRQSGCVLATGRAACEAMACGVPVVICDHRAAYQKPLLNLNIKHSMLQNYSGRGGITPTPDNVRHACEAAMENGSMRDHIKRYHDVKNVVDQLLEAK